MTISAGSLIEAADYNILLGPSTGSGSTVNQLWAIGSNDYGYGQSPISQVAAGNTITATQWANLINTIRSMRLHQSGTAGAFSAPTVGSIITASTIACQSEINTAQTNRLLVNSTGSTTGYSGSFRLTAAAGVAATNTQTRTITFGSIDQCRYFWNAGGSIRVSYTSSVNHNGTARSTNIITLWNTNMSTYTIYARSASGRTGTGASANTNLTAIGFYNLATSNILFLDIDSSSYPYVDDYIKINIRTNGGAGSYSGNGNIVTFDITTYSSTTGSSFVNDALDVTINYQITVTYPPTTYLTNSWGTATLA